MNCRYADGGVSRRNAVRYNDGVPGDADRPGGITIVPDRANVDNHPSNYIQLLVR